MNILLFFSLLLLAADHAVIGSSCPCTSSCVCGCQQAKPCTCLVDGKTVSHSPPKTSETLPPPTTEQPAKQEKETKTEVMEDFRLKGVDFSRISKSPHFTINNRDVTHQEVIEAIENGIPADENKLRLTVFGSLEQRKRVLSDMRVGKLAEVTSHFSVQAYDPDNPVVRHLGFAYDADPTIYVQSPDGTVLHRQDGYDGPERLCLALQRAADPDYDKRNDPDLRVDPKKPSPTPGPGQGDAVKEFLKQYGLLALAVLVVLILFWQKPCPCPPESKEENDPWRG